MVRAQAAASGRRVLAEAVGELTRAGVGGAADGRAAARLGGRALCQRLALGTIGVALTLV